MNNPPTTEDWKPRESTMCLLGIAVVLMIFLLVFSRTGDPTVQSGWIQGLLTLVGVVAASILALRGIVSELDAHKERERQDRLVRIKREAYSDFVRSVAKLDWALGTMWHDKDPYLVTDMAGTNAPLYMMHLAGSIENIIRAKTAMDFFNASMNDARGLRVDLEAVCSEIDSHTKLYEAFDQQRLVVIFAQAHSPDEVERRQASVRIDYLTARQKSLG